MHHDHKRDDIVIVQSVIRRYLAQRKFKAIKSAEKQRQNILNEILTTERKYNSQLRTIMEIFYTPLVQISKQPDSIVSEEDIRKVFNSIETIYSISNQLLQLLEERHGTEGWTPQKSVTDLFLQVTPYMKSLKGYFENYDDALIHLQKMKNYSPYFAKFISVAERHPNCSKLDLPAFLIAPIQRMPRYEMLLASLTQHTTQDTPAWEEASKTATMLQKVNKQLNEGMRVESTQKEMIVLQNLIDMHSRLGGKHAVLLEPHRKLLRIGVVTMCSMRDFSMQRRMLYLCNDILVTGTLFLNTVVKIDKVLPLISAQIISNQKDPDGVSFFLISPVKSHLFFCENHANAVSWMSDIQLAIAHLIENNPENAKSRNEWKLEAVNGRLQVVPEVAPEPEEDKDDADADLDSEAFEESFVVLPPERKPSVSEDSTQASPRPPQPTTPPPPQRPTSLPATPDRLGLVYFDPSCTNHVYEVNAAFLAQREGCTHIPEDSTCIVLPESLQFMMFVSTGHIKFTNRGEGDIVLRSHKRGCARSHHIVGGSFTLLPKSSQSFDFKGAWFVEVVGKCDDLIVSNLRLSGGGKGNKLGMA